MNNLKSLSLDSQVKLAIEQWETYNIYSSYKLLLEFKEFNFDVSYEKDIFHARYKFFLKCFQNIKNRTMIDINSRLEFLYAYTLLMRHK